MLGCHPLCDSRRSSGSAHKKSSSDRFDGAMVGSDCYITPYNDQSPSFPRQSALGAHAFDRWSACVPKHCAFTSVPFRAARHSLREQCLCSPEAIGVAFRAAQISGEQCDPRIGKTLSQIASLLQAVIGQLASPSAAPSSLTPVGTPSEETSGETAMESSDALCTVQPEVTSEDILIINDAPGSSIDGARSLKRSLRSPSPVDGDRDSANTPDTEDVSFTVVSSPGAPSAANVISDAIREQTAGEFQAELSAARTGLERMCVLEKFHVFLHIFPQYIPQC
ncbi:hypothetical protein ACJJTC_011240 [Scirpophaga incertulas]